MKTVAVMFSGGFDSTAAAALVAGDFDRVHLVTCKHSGLSRVEDSSVNVVRLKEFFGREKFVHRILEMDALYRKVSLDGYLGNIRKYGFLTLGNCGLCKLAMHLRTLVYCADEGIEWVADGASKHTDYFPAQMAPVIEELKAMYRRFNITYFNPVYDMDYPGSMEWTHRLGLRELVEAGEEGKNEGNTTRRLLHGMGITPIEMTRRPGRYKKIQPLCLQGGLYNVMAQLWYIPRHGREKYREMTHRFYKEKIERFARLTNVMSTTSSLRC